MRKKRLNPKRDASRKLITEVTQEVMRNLGIKTNGNGSQTALFAEGWKPYAASKFGGGMSDPGSSFDSLLSESMKSPIFSVPGARATPSHSKATYGPMDREKMRVASGGSAGMFGRGLDSFSGGYGDSIMSNYSSPFMGLDNASMFNFSLSRTNPWLTNRMYGSGMYGDIPIYFVMMQEQNGGLLYWPVNIREKMQWLRYFVRTDPFVGTAIDLHTDLPLSRIGFSMPKLKNDPDKKKSKACLKKVQKWSDHVNLFERLMEGFYEYNVIGNVMFFNEWDEENKWWARMVLLPPEEVSVMRFPFCDMAFAQYRPEPMIRLVMSFHESPGSLTFGSTVDKMVYERLPKDIIESITRFGAIIMDTDPFSGNAGDEAGSFMMHLARKRSSYQDMGVSALERVIIPLLQKEHFKYTQLSLASRLMTPRYKICAPGITPDATDYLRTEVDMSMEDPDYHVITNFDFSWEAISASDRLIQLGPEYERIENEILAALGITKELVTGEASYSGSRITLEILNTRYLLIREIFQNYIEKKLLLPMAVANDWYEFDEDTNEKVYYYPKLTFNRLTIRDNADAFDALFQLYQKGSLPLKIILELFNLNPDEMNELLVEDLFTPRDANFNELMRQVYTGSADDIVKNTDVVKKITKHLGLHSTDEKGMPKLMPLNDLNTGLFDEPIEEAESIAVTQAPEEPEENLSVPVAPGGKTSMGEPTPGEGVPSNVEEETLPEGEVAPEETTPTETAPEETAPETPPAEE